MDLDRIENILERAGDLLDEGQPRQALRCLQRVAGGFLDQDQRIECESMRAWALSETGRANEALAALDELLAHHPACARLHGTRGVVLSNAGDLEGGCAALEHSVTLDAEDQFALANLGLVYEKLCEYDRAQQTYEKAIELGFDIDWLLQRLAAVQSDSGETTTAKRTLRRYLSLAPDDAEEWIELAILHSEDQEFEQAYECYQEAERAEPTSPWLRLNWGVTAARAGHWPQAELQLATLRESDSAGTLTLVLEAFFREQKDDPAGAQRDYEAALERAADGDSEQHGYTLEMAMTFFARRGLRAECERLMKRAYSANLCTVEVCAGYREATGRYLPAATWYSVAMEGDYRVGLCEVSQPGAEPAGRYERFTRVFQTVASDPDEAIATVRQFAEHMGETGVALREIHGDEPMSDTHTGIYEVQHQSVVFSGS